MLDLIGPAAAGLVSLVGVAALLWTARKERMVSATHLRISTEVERRRDLLIDKRRTYAGYFAQAEVTRHSVVAVRGFLDPPEPEPDSSSVARAADALGRMFATYYELALVAPPAVQSLAGRLFEEIRDDYAQARVGRPMARRDLTLHDQLLTAMREDLQDQNPVVAEIITHIGASK